MSDNIYVTDPDRVIVTFEGADIISEGIQGPPGAGGQAGGTTGQYLRKASNTDFDTTWDTLDAADIPSLPATIITSETFDAARIPSLPISRITGLETALDGKQPLSAILTAFAGLTPTNDDTLQYISGAWANRTPTQARSTLGLGTIATQAANSVDIDGGSIDGTNIGANAQGTGAFTTITSTGDVRFGAAGATAARLNVNAGAGQVGIKVRANATGSANIQDWEFSNGVVVAFVTNGGNIGAQRFLSDTIQDAGGNSYWALGASSPNRTLTIGNLGNLQTFAIQTKTGGAISLNPSGGSVVIGASSSTLAFYGATAQARSTGWAVSNVTTDKVFDANATTLDELADVLGTLITDLISKGYLAA